jgi:cobaltochelatase CobN
MAFAAGQSFRPRSITSAPLPISRPAACRRTCFDLYYQATLGNSDVRAFLARENPAALAAMQARFAALHAAGLWPTRRNAILAELGA